MPAYWKSRSLFYLYSSNKCRFFTEVQMYHDFITVHCGSCIGNWVVPVYCGNRFCHVCSGIRLSRVKRRIEWLVAHVQKPNGQRLKMVTLSIPNTGDLRQQVSSLIKSFRKLRSRAYWRKRVTGGAFVLEITGKEGSWHAHIHCVCYANWLSWKEVQRIWAKVSSGLACYISDLPEGNAVRYLTKYLTKSQLPEDVQIDQSDALKGTRLFSPFGSWYKTNCTYVKPKPVCPCCGGTDLHIISFPDCRDVVEAAKCYASVKYQPEIE